MAYSGITDIRGFLRPDLGNDGTQNADSQHQTRTIVDDYLDTHFSLNLPAGLELIYGADLLFGLGKQTSVNGAYYAPLLPSGPLPSTTSLHEDEINSERDTRAFGGEYVQMNWKPDAAWDVVGGLRFNQTYEHLVSSHTDGFDPALNLAADHTHKGRRLAGTLGASYRAWREGRDEAVLYANYRNAFKPAAIDFGPDYTPNLLAPETAQSWEAGVRGALGGGRFDYEAGLFLLDFKNLVVRTTDGQGNPLFQNAGGERLKGAELESHYRFTPDLSTTAAISYHDARFTQYVAAEGGANVDAGGRQLTLSPRWLGALGLVYAPSQGFNAALVANYVGKRYLNIANTATAAAYATVNLNLGYRWQRYSLGVDAYNLSDRRPPVSASEFGDQSYYLLPGRTVFVNLGMTL
jgi:iron complex outermembrane receptor protein